MKNGLDEFNDGRAPTSEGTTLCGGSRGPRPSWLRARCYAGAATLAAHQLFRP